MTLVAVVLVPTAACGAPGTVSRLVSGVGEVRTLAKVDGWDTDKDVSVSAFAAWRYEPLWVWWRHHLHCSRGETPETGGP